MRLSWTLACLAFLSLCCPVALYPGDRGDIPDPAPKTVAVAAFKNGLAFVVRHGEVRLQSGTGRIAPIPNATLGTLWLSPDDPGASKYQQAARLQRLFSELRNLRQYQRYFLLKRRKSGVYIRALHFLNQSQSQIRMFLSSHQS